MHGNSGMAEVTSTASWKLEVGSWRLDVETLEVGILRLEPPSSTPKHAPSGRQTADYLLEARIDE
jgi:hypothetical protein